MRSALLGACLACVTALASSCGGASPDGAAGSDALIGDDVAARVDSAVTALLRERSVPGASVAVLRNGDLVLARGYGWADIDGDVTATAGTIYPIGSISKSFTAAAILALVESGDVREDDPLSHYVAGFEYGGDVTIRQLLQHTAGVPEFFTLAGYDEMELGSPDDWQRTDLVTLIRDEPLRFAPGTRWSYSNSNYTLLGIIVEQASGLALSDYLGAEILPRTRLQSTHPCDEPVPGREYARGYAMRAGELVSAPAVNMNMAIGDGSLCADATDLARWMHALATGDVVGGTPYTRMMQPTRLRSGREVPYGYGVSLVRRAAGPAIGHNGAIGGFMGAVAHYPEHDVTVAVLMNLAGGWADVAEETVARAVLGMPPPSLPPEVPLTPAERRAWAGSYDIGVFVVEISEVGERLEIRMPPPGVSSALLHIGDGEMRALTEPHGVRVRFLDDDGTPLLRLRMSALEWLGVRMP